MANNEARERAKDNHKGEGRRLFYESMDGSGLSYQTRMDRVNAWLDGYDAAESRIAELEAKLVKAESRADAMLYQLEEVYTGAKEAEDFTIAYEQIRTAWLSDFDKRQAEIRGK